MIIPSFRPWAMFPSWLNQVQKRIIPVLLKHAASSSGMCLDASDSFAVLYWHTQSWTSPCPFKILRGEYSLIRAITCSYKPYDAADMKLDGCFIRSHSCPWLSVRFHSFQPVPLYHVVKCWPPALNNGAKKPLHVAFLLHCWVQVVSTILDHY